MPNLATTFEVVEICGCSSGSRGLGIPSDLFNSWRSAWLRDENHVNVSGIIWNVPSKSPTVVEKSAAPAFLFFSPKNWGFVCQLWPKSALFVVLLVAGVLRSQINREPDASLPFSCAKLNVEPCGKGWSVSSWAWAGFSLPHVGIFNKNQPATS